MDKIKIRQIIVALIVVSVLSGCTLPGFSTPTPFSFPTPDKTMTALFEPTQAAPATSAAGDSSGSGSDGGDQATATTAPLPTNTSTPEVTETPDEESPTATQDSDISYVGPAVRSGASITATYLTKNINIDGDLYERILPFRR